MENKSQPVSDQYKSISSQSKGLYKDNGSKFISLAYPVESEEEIKEILSNIKKEYFDARHHCFAYRLGRNGETWRINDDGEPSSTAGRPIQGQLLSNELSDILIVVVRYFGGIKLGVPGLIKAYKSAAADAISNAEIITKTAFNSYTIRFGYQDINTIMKRIKEFEIVPKKQLFDNECIIEANIRLLYEEKFIESIKDIATITINQ
jgi:uncharacterized YigZ family protein